MAAGFEILLSKSQTGQSAAKINLGIIIMTTESFPILRVEETDPKTYHAAVWDRVFNYRRNESRVPHAVVKASTIDHITAAVELATQEKRRISIRSGGHSWAI